MKGMELPVNMIIVIAIAVLVLVVVAAFFAGQTGTQFNAVAVNGAISQACANYKATFGCPDTTSFSSSAIYRGILKSGDTASTEYTMKQLCEAAGLPTSDPNVCLRSKCGCPV